MPRYSALRGRVCFDSVYRLGRRSEGKHIGVRAARNGLSVTRRGFAIGRRIGAAVVRNRIRRRLRAAFERAQPAPGWDVVLTARTTAAATTPFADLAGELRALLTSVDVDLAEKDTNEGPNVPRET